MRDGSPRPDVLREGLCEGRGGSSIVVVDEETGSLSPETGRETGGEEEGANAIEDGGHGAFQSSVLVVSVGGAGRVLDAVGGKEVAEVVTEELSSLIRVDASRVVLRAVEEELAEFLDVSRRLRLGRKEADEEFPRVVVQQHEHV